MLTNAGCEGTLSTGSGGDAGAAGDSSSPDGTPGDASLPDTSATGDTAPPDTGSVCGDGVIDPGELCDGDCPASCPAVSCATRRLEGEAASCDARCVDTPIETCVAGDSCCPAGCTPMSDGDCTLDCGDFDGWPADWAAEELVALEELNRHRAAGTDCPSGPKDPVPPLTMDRQLRIAARCHSMDMVTNDFFSHTGSDGSNFSARARAAGYTGGPRAENIAAGNGAGTAAIGQWMGSTTGHCDANMNGGYDEVGLGYARRSGTRWTHYWTAVFGSR